MLCAFQDKSRRGSGDTVDVKVLLEFLKTMHNTKEAEAQHIKSHIEMLDKDIRQVELQLFQSYVSLLLVLIIGLIKITIINY